MSKRTGFLEIPLSPQSRLQPARSNDEAKKDYATRILRRLRGPLREDCGSEACRVSSRENSCHTTRDSMMHRP